MKTYFTFLFFVSTHILNSQTITSFSLPKPGTINSYYTALDADYIEITKRGNNQIWDVARMSGGETSTINYEDKVNGEFKNLYPDANLFINEDGDGEIYYISDESGLRILGAPMESFLNPGVTENGRLSAPVFEIKTPMNLGDQLNQTAYIKINIPISIIPDSIFETLPIKPDSLRLNIENGYNYECSGTGTLKLPGKDFTALQQTVNVNTIARLEAKVPFLGWQDVSSLVDLGLGLGEENKATMINFWSPDEVGYIARFQKDEADGQITSQYTTEGTILKSKADLTSDINFAMYPNPAIAEVSINFSGKTSDLVLQVKDLFGNDVVNQKYNAGQTLSTSTWIPGIYLVHVFADGKLVKTQKLIRI